MEKNLFTKQDLRRLIFPLVAEQFLAMTIGACDAVMVSSILVDGEKGIAVSAVSLIDQLAQLFIQLFAAFATGGAVVASQYLGRHSDDMARKAAKQLLNICVFIGVVLIAVCLPLRFVILNFLFGGADEKVMSNALTYFIWILFSFPLLGVYNSSAALCRSMGNSKISLKVSFVMNLINIVGNAILIYGFQMGVSGAGISTLVSRFVAAVCMIVILHQKGKWTIYLERIWKPEINMPLIKKILKVAVPSGIENSVFHIGKTLVYSFMSGFGTVAIAANGVSNTIASFSNIPGNAIGLASVTVVGQCIGADEKGQAKSYGKKLMKESYLGMFVTAAIVSVATPLLVRLFNVGAEAQLLAKYVVWSCMAANVLFWPMSFVMPNILRGAGDAKFTMVVSNISMWLFRVLSSYLIAKYLMHRFPENTAFALFGVWIGMYIDWIFRGLFFGLRFHKNRWLEQKVI
ncbi:MAG: MATE family efflux transporter [Treponema sp.]|nr:MATE family efflux transporter [Treponema sp.]